MSANETDDVEGAEPRLIFDLGMHHGADTSFYLSKGFRVIAVEANPALARRACEQFEREIADGQLVVLEKALWREDDDYVEFFISENDIWSSLSQDQAERDLNQSRAVKAPSITLERMMCEFGVPYYIKCDMEGGEEIVADALFGGARRPDFVSLEVASNAADLMAKMFCAGYDRMQVVNQALHHQREMPNPSREGRYAPLPSGMVSGIFGRDLPHDDWRTLAETSVTIGLWHELFTRVAIGWIDVHFTSTARLSAQ